MLATSSPLRCRSCDSEELGAPIATAEKDYLVCERCGQRSTREELCAIAEARFTSEVDLALARTRRMRERFPHR